MLNHNETLPVISSYSPIGCSFALSERSDIIIPRGIENRVAIEMVVMHIQRRLLQKSKQHREELERLGKQVVDEPLSPHVLLLKETPQIRAMNTILQNPMTSSVDFIFYFDRLATLLVERFDAPIYAKYFLNRAQGNG